MNRATLIAYLCNYLRSAHAERLRIVALRREVKRSGVVTAADYEALASGLEAMLALDANLALMLATHLEQRYESRH